MKNLVGKNILVRTDGLSIKGKMIADFPDRIVIVSPSETGKSFVTNVQKDKIAFFILEEEKSVEELSNAAELLSGAPLTVLACENKSIGCIGVRCVANKYEKDLKKSDFEEFMAPCPVRQASCKCGTMGNLYTMDGKVLQNILGGMIVGEYPEPKSTRSSNISSIHSEKSIK